MPFYCTLSLFSSPHYTTLHPHHNVFACNPHSYHTSYQHHTQRDPLFPFPFPSFPSSFGGLCGFVGFVGCVGFLGGVGGVGRVCVCWVGSPDRCCCTSTW